MAKDDQEAAKEAFVAGADRPEVRFPPDTLVRDLKVRDLVDILGVRHFTKAYLTPAELYGKHYVKEKNELKDALGKHEYAEVPVGHHFVDPRVDVVIQGLTGLAAQVSQLSDQVAQLQRG